MVEHDVKTYTFNFVLFDISIHPMTSVILLLNLHDLRCAVWAYADDGGDPHVLRYTVA